MKRIGKALSYSNVVATIALFLALGGGVVYAASHLGKNAVKSKNIAANAVKARNLAKNAVKSKSLAANSVTNAKIKKDAITSRKVRKGALSRSDMAVGTLAGLQVAEVTAASVPGLSVKPGNGMPIPLTGTPTFTPAAGKSYELLVELRGNPVDADGSGEGFCNPFVSLFVDGAQLSGASMLQDATSAPPFNYDPIGTSSTAIALQAAGEPQTLSATSFGSSGCSSATTASLRAVVIQLG